MAKQDFSITIENITHPTQEMLRPESAAEQSCYSRKVSVGILAPAALMIILCLIGVHRYLAVSISLVAIIPLGRTVGRSEVRRKHREAVFELRRYWNSTPLRQDLTPLMMILESVQDDLDALQFLELWVSPSLPLAIAVISLSSFLTGHALSIFELCFALTVGAAICSWLRMTVLNRLALAVHGKSVCQRF